MNSLVLLLRPIDKRSLSEIRRKFLRVSNQLLGFFIFGWKLSNASASKLYLARNLSKKFMRESNRRDEGIYCFRIRVLGDRIIARHPIDLPTRKFWEFPPHRACLGTADIPSILKSTISLYHNMNLWSNYFLDTICSHCSVIDGTNAHPIIEYFGCLKIDLQNCPSHTIKIMSNKTT